MKIKTSEELYAFPPGSQENVVLWVTEAVVKQRALWSLCFDVLSKRGALRVVCGPWLLSSVYQSLKEAGFEDFELNVWAYGGKEGDKPVITDWEEWSNWYSPSWRPLIVARKSSGRSNHRASLLSFFQKPFSEGSLVDNLKKWDAGLLRVREGGEILRDCFLIHSKDCTSQECAPRCSIFTMDLNRKNLSPSQNFIQIPCEERAFLDVLLKATTIEGGETLESYKISTVDFSSIPESSLHSIVAQGNPKGFVSKIYSALRPGGFYVRVASSEDPLGIVEDVFLGEGGLSFRGHAASVFETGCCVFTSSNKGFMDLVGGLSLPKASVIVKSKVTSFVSQEKESDPPRRGGICAMFGS